MNDYLKELNTVVGTSDWEPDSFSCEPKQQCVRRDFAKEYAWAIPNEDAIDTLVEEDPLIEIGAGNGYWASLVEEKSGDVMAIDIDPPEETYTTVSQTDHTIASDHPNRTLFMCWPSYGDEWAAEAVELYEGDTVIYVGEGRGGATADENFHQQMSQDFGLADEVIDIPQWAVASDRMYVFRR